MMAIKKLVKIIFLVLVLMLVSAGHRFFTKNKASQTTHSILNQALADVPQDPGDSGCDTCDGCGNDGDTCDF